MFKGIKNLADVSSLEATPLDSRGLPENILQAFQLGQSNCQDRDALIFVRDANKSLLSMNFLLPQ
jgi:hypothetical protein